MTRKDYKALAMAFAVTYPRLDTQARRTEVARWYKVRDQIADALQEDNPRFDRDRFNAATIPVT